MFPIRLPPKLHVTSRPQNHYPGWPELSADKISMTVHCDIDIDCNDVGSFRVKSSCTCPFLMTLDSIFGKRLTSMHTCALECTHTSTLTHIHTCPYTTISQRFFSVKNCEEYSYLITIPTWEGTRNSPLSKIVPAVNESSESCSALQAYKALAFRNGVLYGNRSLFRKVKNPRKSQMFNLSSSLTVHTTHLLW